MSDYIIPPKFVYFGKKLEQCSSQWHPEGFKADSFLSKYCSQPFVLSDMAGNYCTATNSHTEMHVAWGTNRAINLFGLWGCGGIAEMTGVCETWI